MSRPRNFEDVLSKFPAAKQSGDHWVAPCLLPGHKHPAGHLTITDGTDKALITDQGGRHNFTDKQDYDALCQIIGFDSLNYSNNGNGHKEVKAYSYVTTEGNLLYQVVRYEPKAFKQRRPDGNGGWIWNLKGIEPVLYHQDRLPQAIKEGFTIFICEGEKDVDRLSDDYGRIATCNPMGAGKWRNTYSKALKGADVIIIPDADLPGREHAIKVAQSCQGIAKRVRMLELPGAKDISDWLDNGGDIDEFEVLIKSSKDFNPLLSNNTNNIIKYRNLSPENGNSLERLQVTQQVGDKSRDYGELAAPFDKFLKEHREPHWKRDVAERIGTTYKDRSFQALVRRRAVDDHQIRILHGGDKIQWVNLDWRSNLIPLDAGKRSQLGLILPFGMEKYVGCSERSQIVVAGDVGSGKTHYGYLLAELNVGKINIRHFVNEMGDSKATKNLEDFPLLREHYGEDYFLISQDRDNLEVVENLDPDGLNIYDYLRMSDNKEWYLALQKTLAALPAKLDRGIVVVMLQKKKGQELGYGGEGTRMQAETYISLNVVKNADGYKLGRLDILKCREWATHINPEGYSIEYKTAAKHGKLIIDGDWHRPAGTGEI